ncbi:MAG: phosphoglucosamine mutase, partial [Proteobacteria bacterium]|nr:phosphoglucosamine mutase [Pseudomonadota bacterium]
LDCAHGATYHIAPSVLRELGAEVIELGTSPDGYNINAGVGSTCPENVRAAVIEKQADLGISLDGDGDRVIMVDENGEVVDGDELLFIITNERHRTGELRGGVVGTQMSNFGLELALQDKGIPFVRARVGDRYVLSELSAHGWVLGGESSGHILCLDLTTTGDGLVSALQVLAAMQESGQSLSAIKRGMTKFPQRMINVSCSVRPGSLEEFAAINEAVAAVEHELGGKGRVLLRPSGTEPVVRVMVEGENEALVARLTENLAAVVQEQVG